MNKLHVKLFKKENSCLHFNNISCSTVFDQINATLVSIRDLFQKQQNRSKANIHTFCIVKMRCIQDVKVYRFTENGRNAHKTTCKAPQVSTELDKTIHKNRQMYKTCIT